MRDGAVKLAGGKQRLGLLYEMSAATVTAWLKGKMTLSSELALRWFVATGKIRPDEEEEVTRQRIREDIIRGIAKEDR